MNEPKLSASPGETGSAAEHSALFAQLVFQQSNMAMLLLGKVPHPETGQVTRDLEAAKLFIDQLEMLEAKTKGNLNRQEAAFLQQSLTTLRLSFVEAVESPAPAQPTSTPGSDSSTPSPGAPPPSAAETDEHRRKFSKKY